MGRDLRIDRYYRHSPPEVWSALTDSDAIATWLAASDFVPEVGCEFTLQTTRGPGFDGHVQCKVVTVDPPRTLVFTWDGGPVHTVVAVRLRPEGQGTRLTLVQKGFEGGRGYLASMFLAIWWDGALRGAPLPNSGPSGPDPRLAFLGGASALTALIAALLIGPILLWPKPVPASSPEAGEPPRSADANGRDHRMAKADRAKQAITATDAALDFADEGDREPGDDAESQVLVPATGLEIKPQEDGHIVNPVFSSDGKFIAYEVHYEGSSSLEIATVEPDPKRTPVHLPGAPSREDVQAQAPSWHASGIVLFEATQAGRTSRIYYHQPGSGSAAEMFSFGELPARLEWPIAMPNGAFMAFTAEGQLGVRNTNTGEVALLTDGAPTVTGPTFGWDETLLFARIGDGLDIYSVGLEGQAEREIVGGPGDQTRPAKADNRLVFFEKTGRDWNLVSTQIGNRGLILLRDVRLPHRAAPAVSPDGTWVAGAHDDPSKSGSIALIRTDGTARFDVKVNGVGAGEPAMSVQNGRTLLAWTALPKKGADWRTLRIVDVTDSITR